jgi:hypothetical protein
VRILLDEMYRRTIAEGLRRRRHDAVAVTERPELRNLPDPELFAAAQAERRAVVTENIRDFVPIADDYETRGIAHHGLVLVHPAAYPRGRSRTIGLLVTALAGVCERTATDDPASFRCWL